MLAGIYPVSPPVQIATACGVGSVGGTKGHLAFSSPAAFPGTLLASLVPTRTLSSVLASGSNARRRSGRRSAVDYHCQHPPLALASLFRPEFWGSLNLLLPGPGETSGLGSSAAQASTGHLRMSGSQAAGAFPVEAENSQDSGSESASAGEVSAKGGGGRGERAADFPPVTLDTDAVQKFAEIEVRWGGADESCEPTVLIRGLKSAEYHIQAAEPTMARLREVGADATITGGGRIKHSKRRSIFIYGYSMQFGPANLPRVADLCRKQYPADYEVTWTEGGY